jgi:endonuclease III
MNDMLFNVIRTCASLEDVREEVFKNHDDNQWWPLFVKDWRLRMVVVGWSTRIHYFSMIQKYREVVFKVNEVGYEQFCRFTEGEMRKILEPLGLIKSRIQYFKSIVKFIKEYGKEKLLEMPNDDLIELIKRQVWGAGYKVAQCAVLYAKGYHCGVFPVDSGMKDMLGPCIGFHLPRGPKGHEIMRKCIGKILKAHPLEYHNLALDTGYKKLKIPEKKAPIWWAHLVLIYFKRRYCNYRKYRSCPLRADLKIGKYIGTMCDSKNPQSGVYQ